MKTISLSLIACGLLAGCGPNPPAVETPVTPAPTVVPSPTVSPTPAMSSAPVTTSEGAGGPIVTPGATNRDKALVTEPPSDAAVTPGSSPGMP